MVLILERRDMHALRADTPLARVSFSDFDTRSVTPQQLEQATAVFFLDDDGKARALKLRSNDDAPRLPVTVAERVMLDRLNGILTKRVE